MVTMAAHTYTLHPAVPTGRTTTTNTTVTTRTDTMAHTMSNYDDVPLNPAEGVNASFMSHGNGRYTLSMNGGTSGASVTLHLDDATIDAMVRLREEWTTPVKSDEDEVSEAAE